MREFPLLTSIGLALSYALVGGVIARRLGLPTIVGYLLAGVALGPFTPGFVGDVQAIRQLAELGIILLMFGIGLHFSLTDVWQVRDIAIPGAMLQMVVATALGWWLAIQWGWSAQAALVFGIAISVASTVVLLRGLMDIGALDTPHGRVAVGWLVTEDIATVVILVLLPVLTSTGGGNWQDPFLAILRALLFVTIMLFAGKHLVGVMLGWVARTGSRELFIVLALTMAVGLAAGSASLFGVSLALGAFLAGVVVSESPFSHQVGADLLPFREAFAVLFFVSVGMLVDPRYVLAHWREVVAVTALIVIARSALTAIVTFAFPYPARTALVVAAGRSQIGEFSFIVGQTGLRLNLLDESQYALILAGALVSITLNPWMFRLIDPVERWLKRWPRLWMLLDRHGPPLEIRPEAHRDHAVIIGCGRVGRHVAEVLGRLSVPRLVIEVDPKRLDRLRELGVPVLYGDAANSEILRHAALERARVLIVTVSDEIAGRMIVESARRWAPTLHIVVRASTWAGAHQLSDAGANAVIWPELEGGVEFVGRTLQGLGFPSSEIQRQTDAARRQGLNRPANSG